MDYSVPESIYELAKEYIGTYRALDYYLTRYSLVSRKEVDYFEHVVAGILMKDLKTIQKQHAQGFASYVRKTGNQNLLVILDWILDIGLL